MKNKLNIAVVTAFISMFINLVFADGHSNCKNSKWGAEDELGGANYVSEERTKNFRHHCFSNTYNTNTCGHIKT